MNIGLITGHGQGDSGAIGNGYQEQALVREIVPNIKNELSNVANVFVFDSNLNAYNNIAKVKEWVRANNINYVLEVHLNSGGTPYGTGTEIFVTTSEKYSTVEQKIVNNLATLYPPARSGGVKVMNWAVIKNIKSIGVSCALVEVFFINNPNEVNRYLSNKQQTAKLIADGIKEGFGLNGISEPIQPVPTPTPQPQPVETDLTAVARRVIRGEFGNGDDRKKNLKSAGYDYNQVQPIVNLLLGQGSSSSSGTSNKKTNEQIADEIIRGTGEWYQVNGQARKDKLSAMGYDASAVQAIINRKLG